MLRCGKVQKGDQERMWVWCGREEGAATGPWVLRGSDKAEGAATARWHRSTCGGVFYVWRSKLLDQAVSEVGNDGLQRRGRNRPAHRISLTYLTD